MKLIDFKFYLAQNDVESIALVSIDQIFEWVKTCHITKSEFRVWNQAIFTKTRMQFVQDENE